MSVLTESSVPTPFSAPRTVWIRVESGLWVATRDGAHLGRVELSGRRFRAFTGRGLDLGTFPRLADAQGEIVTRS